MFVIVVGVTPSLNRDGVVTLRKARLACYQHRNQARDLNPLKDGQDSMAAAIHELSILYDDPLFIDHSADGVDQRFAIGGENPPDRADTKQIDLTNFSGVNDLRSVT